MISDLIGRKFQRLTVIKKLEPYIRPSNGIRKHKTRSLWLCVCECGNEKQVLGEHLRRGAVVSCGCFQMETRKMNGHNNATHRKSGERIYRIWRGMLNRCYNTKDRRYSEWGGRGIKVCQEWHTFENFYRDMGECPINMSIDRIDNFGDYNRENCRWADAKMQANNRQNNKLITINGESLSVTQWAEKVGILPVTIFARIRNGWDKVDAVITPVEVG